jgi:hypothetical protein
MRRYFPPAPLTPPEIQNTGCADAGNPIIFLVPLPAHHERRMVGGTVAVCRQRERKAAKTPLRNFLDRGWLSGI